MSASLKQLSIAFVVCIAVLAVAILALVYGYAKIKAATERAQARQSSGKVQTLAAVDPVAYLIERVGGEFVDVAVLTPQGKDPETFAPTPRQLAEVAATRVFFCVGLPIEKRFAESVDSIAPDSETVDLADGLELLADPDAHDHAAEGENAAEHEHEESVDPHLWTSPANARAMVAKIADSLSRIDAAHEQDYRANAAALDQELADLQKEIAEQLAPYEGRAFVVFHPAYGYFAREFRLVQLPIEIEGRAPQPRQLESVIERVKKDGVHKLIIQPEFNRSSAQVVADEIGGELLDHSPLQKDYFANLRLLTDEIVASFATEN